MTAMPLHLTNIWHTASEDTTGALKRWWSSLFNYYSAPKKSLSLHKRQQSQLSRRKIDAKREKYLFGRYGQIVSIVTSFDTTVQPRNRYYCTLLINFLQIDTLKRETMWLWLYSRHFKNSRSARQYQRVSDNCVGCTVPGTAPTGSLTYKRLMSELTLKNTISYIMFRFARGVVQSWH